MSVRHSEGGSVYKRAGDARREPHFSVTEVNETGKAKATNRC